MRFPGSLRTLCQLGVALWIALGLSLAEPRAPGESEPVVETRTAPLEPPPPRPSPASSPAPVEPTRVGSGEIEAGMDLLAAGGRFPVLTCGYEHFASFASYARAMTALGARFVVVERRSIRAVVDLERGTLQPGSPGPAFSPRARDYSGEPALSSPARRARERFGTGAEVMMLVPRQLDAGLFGGISRALAERGEGPEEYQELEGRYESDGAGGVRLRVDAGVRRDGSRTPLDLLFDLGQIASAARGAAPADA